MDWSKFDSKCDIQGMKQDIKKASENSFEEVPVGKYEVALEKLEMKATKKNGYPMMVAQFKVVEGEYKKRKIFVNQVLFNGDAHDGLRLQIAETFLRNLDTGIVVDFEGFQAFSELIDRIAVQAVDEEYLLEIGEKKGFRNYKILEHYVADNIF